MGRAKNNTENTAGSAHGRDWEIEGMGSGAICSILLMFSQVCIDRTSPEALY